MAAQGSSLQPSTYSCKWGNVTILDRRNYSVFKTTCEAALIAADAWDIVQQIELEPANLATPAGKEFKVRRGRALQIMFNSVSEGLRSTVKAFMENQDPSGMWHELATFDPASDRLFITETVQAFHKDHYDPPNDTIDAFATRLVKAQQTLVNTSNAVTEEALHLRLAMGLPETQAWQTAKQFVLNQHTTFDTAVRYLQTVESSNKSSESTAAANMARRYRKNQRRSEKRFKRDKNKDGSDSSTKGPLDPDQCSWCLKKGHWEKDCREYKKAKARARAKGSRRYDSDSDADESAELADAYAYSAYSTSPYMDGRIDGSCSPSEGSSDS